MRVLVIDVGGTHVKILASGHRERRMVESGPTMTAPQLVSAVEQLAAGWKYEAVSIDTILKIYAGEAAQLPIFRRMAGR